MGKGSFKQRFRILVLAMIFIALCIFVGGFWNIFSQMSEIRQLESRIDSKEHVVYGRRGNIRASDGSPLAVSINLYELHIDFATEGFDRVGFKKEFSKTVSQLSKILKDRSSYQYKLWLQKGFKKRSRYYPLTKQKVNYSTLEKIRAIPFFSQSKYKSGLIVSKKALRSYPLNFKLGRTIGRLNRENLDGEIQASGKYGLEEGFQDILKGGKGIYRKERASSGWIRNLVEKPEVGSDVVTTIDIQIQDAVENALGTKVMQTKADWGSAIVMDVHTGDIVALSNLELNKSDRLIEGRQNYAIGNAGNIEPGSTFKLASLLTCLETGKIDTSKVYDTEKGIWQVADQKVRDSDWKEGGHGKLNVSEIIQKSSNVGTAKMVTDVFGDHPDQFINRLYYLKLNEPFHINIKGLGKPEIRHPSQENWWGTTLAWMSFGYGLKMTPLHTLTLYNAIANDGVMMEPRLVQCIQNQKDGVTERFPTTVRVNSIGSQKTITEIQKILEEVVEHGTARRLKTSKYHFSGKTGTAQIAVKDKGYVSSAYYASFVGYFPSDHPRYSCIVVIANPKFHGYYGGQIAGPVFREIADMLYSYDVNIHQKDEVVTAPLRKVGAPKYHGFLDDIKSVYGFLEVDTLLKATTSLVRVENKDGKTRSYNERIKKHIVPDVKGMSASDAMFLLENRGYHVHLSGKGHVIKQSVKAGTKLKDGGHVYLQLY
ncbi:transpeptidase family protein [Halosquirtibacter xylanolyticus]|uniref:penicillin-binding protein n=1 Tax=Halosquirtibacter xylanolyticus TaxID=3374599 RepID=UPI00374871BD|nr:transpeptidase family protein [Prolixibacteraceae bacterium]